MTSTVVGSAIVAALLENSKAVIGVEWAKNYGGKGNWKDGRFSARETGRLSILFLWFFN